MQSMRVTTALSALALVINGSTGEQTSRVRGGWHGPKHPSTSACDVLASALPGLVALPDSTSYALSSNYWSQRQSEVHPSCFVTPKTTAHVSTTMKILTTNNAPFAVKSGGHTAFAGGSNLASGVTIDLRLLNTITVSADRKTVSVGAGNRWVNISTILDPLGLAVVGGRVSDPGVGGLTLGGGISYFSGQRGWACDNVQQYEVVLASGDVIIASATQDSDLYWALRGGAATNLGIVTRFDLASFEQGPLWAQSLVFDGVYNTTLIPLFQNLTVNGLPSDPGAHTYFGFVRVPGLEGYLIYSDQFHASPASTDPAISPVVFEQFNRIPAMVREPRMSNLTSLLHAIELAYGNRQSWSNTAVKGTSAALLQDILSLHEAHVARVAARANGSPFTPYLTFQPIPVNVLQAMQVNGGNALGLNPQAGPLIIVQSTTTWNSPALDPTVESSSREFIRQVNKLAKDRGLDHGFVYINYAETSQDVFGSYGKASLQGLRKVALKYDPDGLLQKLWKGYFKLWA